VPRPVKAGAFENDLPALQTIRKRLLATQLRKSQKDKLLTMCDELHDGLRSLANAIGEKRAE
jgi:Mg2+ and Co2+ transporter CorA